MISQASWRPSVFDHNINTAYDLAGQHQNIQCSGCHQGVFAGTPTDCYSCHLFDYENANEPDHMSAQIETDCQVCHLVTQAAWNQSIFNHDQNTAFMLEGRHTDIQCSSCHQGVFTGTPADCYSCHQANYENAINPDHVSAAIDTDCQLCHLPSQQSWIQSVFNHDVSSFALSGRHDDIQCSSCHDGIFDGLASDCWSCHETEYLQTGTAVYPDSPAHSDDPQFVSDCSICHSTSSWVSGTINHSLTAFPLIDAHLAVDCITCHEDGYDLPVECAGCHSPAGLAVSDFLSAEFDHESHQLPSDCSLCHTQTEWAESNFLHENFTATACENCHQLEYDEAALPVHINDNIRSDCEVCHVSSNWEIVPFPHTQVQTDYPLLGLHIITDCESCHPNDIFNTTPVNCENSACHLEIFNNTVVTDHQLYGYPPAYCELCHNELGWEPHIFIHSTEDGCVTCHQPDYDTTTNPPHLADNGFSINCETCHNSTVDWTDASFDHSLTSQTCVTCHLSEYQATTNPDHLQSGFGDNCEICHNSTTDWTDAIFEHGFPIAPSGHQDEDNETCQSCHQSPFLAPDFTCTLSPCHQGIDGEHFDDGSYVSCSVGGNTYTYSPGAADNPQCTNCHPSGSEDDCEESRSLRHRQMIDEYELSPN